MQLTSVSRPSLPQRQLSVATAAPQEDAAPKASKGKAAPKQAVKASASKPSEKSSLGFTDVLKTMFTLQAPEKKAPEPVAPPKEESWVDKLIPGKKAPEPVAPPEKESWLDKLIPGKKESEEKKKGIELPKGPVEQAKFLWKVTKKIAAVTAFVAKTVGQLIPNLDSRKELHTTREKTAYLGRATMEIGASVGVATAVGAIVGAFVLPSLIGMIPVAGPFLVKILSLRWLAIGGAMLTGQGWGLFLHRSLTTKMFGNPSTYTMTSGAMVAASGLVGGIAAPALGLMVGAPLLPMAAIGLVSGAAIQGAFWYFRSKKPAKAAKAAAVPAKKAAVASVNATKAVAA